MLGRLDRDQRSVHIIGGGAAGMFAAYYLDRAGFEVYLYESSDRLGGMITTSKNNFGTVEVAANSLVSSNELIGLANDLGINLQPISKSAKAKYILKNGRLTTNPFSPWEVVRLIWRAMFRKIDQPIKTMRDLGEKVFWPQVADYAIEPMITGIFGSRADEVIVSAAFPRLQPHVGKSLWRSLKENRRTYPNPGKRIILAPELGMQSLFEALSQRLQERLGSRLRLNQRVDQLPASGNRVLCVPAAGAGKLVEKTHPDLAAMLTSIEYTPMMTAGVFLRKADLERPPEGLGVLIPPQEDRKILGVLFSSSCFPNRVADNDHILLTVMLGGSRRSSLLDLNDQQIRTIIIDELHAIFGLHSDPLEIVVTRWPAGIPKYNQHLVDTLALANRTWCQEPGNILFGNYSGEVSLRGMLSDAARLSLNLPIPGNSAY